jgi:hypothetical protein
MNKVELLLLKHFSILGGIKYNEIHHFLIGGVKHNKIHHFLIDWFWEIHLGSDQITYLL